MNSFFFPFWSTPLEEAGEQVFWLPYSLLYPQSMRQCLEHSGYLRNVNGMNKGMSVSTETSGVLWRYSEHIDDFSNSVSDRTSHSVHTWYKNIKIVNWRLLI